MDQTEDLGFVPDQTGPSPAPAQPQDDLGFVPDQPALPDNSVMKDYVTKNLQAYQQSQAYKDTHPEQHPAKTFWESLKAGFQDSSFGLAWREKMPDTVVPPDAGRMYRIGSQVGQLAGDLPAMMAGGSFGGGFGAGLGGVEGSVVPVAGTAAGAVTGAAVGAMAGAFAVPKAMRKILIDHYEKGDITTAGDFAERLAATSWEAIKGATTGAATAVTGGYAGLAGGTISKLGAELGTMTTVGSALEGHLPNLQDFIDGAIVLGGLHAATGGTSSVASKLRNIYAETGMRPHEVVEEANKNVELKQQLLSDDPKSPPEAQPTELKHYSQADGTIPSSEEQAKNLGVTKRPTALEVANEAEKSGAAFFTRNSDDSMTIFVKGEHGNDPNQWINARKIQDAIGSKAGEIVPDPQSGHLIIRVRDAYADTEATDKPEIPPPHEQWKTVPKEETPQSSSDGGDGQGPERSDAEKEILSKIGTNPESPKKTFAEKFSDFYAKTIDYLSPIKDAVKDAKANGADISPDQDSYKLGRLFAAHMDKVNSFFEFGTRDAKTGEKNGEGLNEILKSIPDNDLDGFRAYAMAKRALDLADRGITPWKDFDADGAREVTDAGAEKFESIRKRLVDYENRVLDYAKDKGLLSEEALQRIKDANENHIPFNRVQDPDTFTGKVKGSTILKRIFGSEKDLLDPVLQVYRNTEMIIRRAEVNEVRNAFVDNMRQGDLIEDDPENPKDSAYLKKVPPKMLPKDIGSDELARALKKQGIDVEPDDITIFRPETSYLKDNQIAVMEDGKRVVYEGPSGVIDSLKRLEGDRTSIDVWSKVMRTFANMTRIGTVLNPAFGFAHFFRSQTMAGVYSKTGMIPFYHSALALKDFMQNSPAYQDWLFNGGASSSWFKLDDNYLADNKVEEAEKTAPFMGRAWNAVHTIAEATESFIKLTDNLSRFAEYKRSIEQGKSQTEAAFNSREVVPDYQKVGLQRSILRSSVAFIGAHINSLDRMTQAFKEDPKSTIAKLSALTAISAMVWAVNKDDPAIDALPDWQKNTYWNLNISRMSGIRPDGKLPDGSDKSYILRLPKPWAPGIIFGSGVEVALDQYYKDKPQELGHFMESFMKSVAPEPIPNILSPVLDQYSNKQSFTGRPLVSEDKEKLLPELKYEPYTSETAKQIAKLIGYVPLVRDIGPSKDPLSSPTVVENYIHAWSGTLGGWALKIADAGLRSAGIGNPQAHSADTIADAPFINQFISRYPSFKSQDVQDFYENKEKTDQVLKSIKYASKHGDLEAASRIAQTHPDLEIKLDGIAKGIGAAKKVIQMIQDDPKTPAVEKRQIIDTILFQIGSMAKQGNQLIGDFQKQVKEKK